MNSEKCVVSETGAQKRSSAGREHRVGEPGRGEHGDAGLGWEVSRGRRVIGVGIRGREGAPLQGWMKEGIRRWVEELTLGTNQEAVDVPV